MSKWLTLNNEITVMKDGKYQLDKDKEAAHSYFVDFVNQNTVFFHSLEEKIDYLIEENYYEKEFLDKYKFEQVKEVFKHAYSFKFRFPSYISAFSFYDKYALRTRDNKRFLERYEDRIATTALYLANGSFKSAMSYCDKMIKQIYQPATPTFMNCGKKARGEMVSCFLLDSNDSMNDISFTLRNCLELSRLGGGVSVNLTPLRARSESIKGIENRASGVVPVMKLLEDAFTYSNQLGVRKGSGVAWLSVFHSDIIEFLSTKKINVDEKVRIKTLSIGVSVPDKFLELAEQDKDFYVFYPYTVQQEYGLDLDEINWDEMYDEIVSNPKVRKKKMSARSMFNELMRTLFESGYPYVMFEGNTNEAHPLKYLGRVKKSNLCVEVLQYSSKTTINEYGEQDEIGLDISCNLGSLNIVNVMEHKDIESATREAMKMLTSVSEMSSIKNVPSIQKANDLMKSVGLGFMNLHGYLAKNGVMYGSKASIDFARTFFSTVNYWSIYESMLMAANKNKKFYGFEKSTYATGEYFDTHIKEDYQPKMKRVQKLFEGIYIPTQEDWKKLKEKVMENGLYNSYRIAIPPTGSISYVQSATPSVLPIVDKIERRKKGDSFTIYPMPYLEKADMYYETAYDIDQIKVIDLVSEIQKHVDQGISFTLHFKGEPVTSDLARYYAYAWKKGIKTLYYIRTQLTQVEVCESCTV